MDDALQLFHFAETGNLDSKKALILLHGTGGSETDLFPIVAPFSKTHRILGLLGNVREHGMARFFERDAFGVFDQNSIQVEVNKLVSFLTEWMRVNNIKPNNMTCVGYSNGGNMILATLFSHPDLFQKAAVLHSMLPFVPSPDLDLSAHSLFASWGHEDLMIPEEKSAQMVIVLRGLNSDLQVVETDSGHQLTRDEVEKLHNFLKK